MSIDRFLIDNIRDGRADLQRLQTKFDEAVIVKGKLVVRGKLSDWPEENVDFWVKQLGTYRKFPRYGGMQVCIILEDDNA